MEYVWLVVIGFIVGLIARAVKPGDDKMGLIMTSVLGIGGALIANVVGNAMGLFQNGGMMKFIASIAGAVVLLFIYGMLKKK